MSNPIVSVVIPVYNEARTISSLLSRLNQTLVNNHVEYEVIIIDDHSTDQTLDILEPLRSLYPLSVYQKATNDIKGKGYSLLAGFKQSKGEIIVMIDADLQYPPEAIPLMLARIQSGADLVVADRTTKKTTLTRRFTGYVFQTIFAQMLHGMKVDTQSGLKAFRKELLSRITLQPHPFSFDLELVSKTQQAGYTIATVPIVFEKRQGKSRLNLVHASYQIGKRALSLKAQNPEVFPFLPEMIAKEGHGFHFQGNKYIPHNRLPSRETALYRFARNQKVFLAIFGLFLIVSLFFYWHTTLTVVIAVLTVLYFSDLLFNLYLIYRGFTNPPEIKVSESEIAEIPESLWPSYTIFCPLYKEPEVIPQFVRAMSNLDYPQEKLQIMLLLEEDDTETIQKARNMMLPDCFEIVVVPHSLPKTKPKACNYGLLHARGELCVIYDAEDVPDPDQLKKAALAFRKSPKNIACIQARLNFYNPHQNILTRAFTAEYSLWFDLVLTGLQSINAPIPLGGTSNHFRTQQLRDLHGWDAFNVTEDCDLGIRLIKRGFHTSVLDSTTLEEANSDLANWFSQRSRWIKGYMQTYLVHMRRPGEFMKQWDEPHVITFQLVVGGKILSMLINPLMWVLTIAYFLFRPIIGPAIESFYPAAVLYMAVFSLVFGNFLYAYYYMVGCARRNHDELIKFVFLVPLYWLAMSFAAWKAIRELIVRPHHWAKTKHGLHLTNRKGLEQTQASIGLV
ncbi:MAG: glycosyltransferase [Candidatus Woesebacteria bacterium]